MSEPTLLVIIGSVRPKRIGPKVAAWVAGLGRGATGATFEPVDLRDWPLPMDDEPEIPAGGAPYAGPHTRAWSRKVAAADGFIFVTPQYNWGYPAPQKNAIDHLYAEWRGKPVAIVTYGGHGGHGGGKCAAQLREVLTGLKMRIVDEAPALTLSNEQVHGNSGGIDAPTAFAAHEATVVKALRDLAALATPSGS